jgi:hypothetical protein
MKIFLPIKLYSAKVVGLVTAGTLFVMHDRYNRLMQESSSFGDRMLETACILFFIPEILVPFTHWYECGKKRKIHKQMEKNAGVTELNEM